MHRSTGVIEWAEPLHAIGTVRWVTFNENVHEEDISMQNHIIEGDVMGCENQGPSFRGRGPQNQAPPSGSIFQSCAQMDKDLTHQPGRGPGWNKDWNVERGKEKEDGGLVRR